MKQFVIPSIFTAVDKFSKPVDKMTKNSNAAFARMDRNMRKVSKRAFGVAKNSAMVGAAIIAPMALLANEAVSFETNMSNVATLIDTNSESIEAMGDKVLDLSKKLPVPIEELTASLYDVRSAGIDSSKAMETLEGSAKLSVAGLSSVEEATNISTSALNAFASEGLTAAQTNNILFKTVKAGKTTISELAQSFGAATQLMSGAGVKLADFSAATAALTTTGVPASVAQTQLRASISKLLKPTAEMQEIFEDLGVTTGKDLLSNYDNLGDAFSAISSKSDELGVNLGKAWGSTEAMGAATALTTTQSKAYTNTLLDMTNGVDDLGIAYDKQSKTGKSAMQIAKNNMQSLSITLGQTLIPIITDLVAAVSPVLKRFSKWAKENKSTVSTIMKVAAAVAGMAIALAGISFVVGVATKGMALFNMVLAANPIGLVVAGVVLLGAGLYGLTKAFSSVNAAQELNNEIKKRTLENTIDERVEVKLLFKALRKAEEGSTAYNATLQKLEQLQPGIIEKHNLQTKSLENLNAAEKELTKSIIKRGMEEARANMIREKAAEVLTSQTESLGFFEGTNILDLIKSGGNTEEAFKQKKIEKTSGLENELEILSNQQAASMSGESTPAINSEKTKQDAQNQFIENTTKEQVTVKFENLPDGATVEGTGGSNFAMPSLGSTR